jgi:hypothetical protein
MKRTKSIVKVQLALVCLLLVACPAAHAQVVEPSGVPTTVQPTPNQTPQQQQTHFLTFIGSFVPESPATANAYYNAIDPGKAKRDFPSWLLNAGFISNVNQWNSTGPQVFTSTPGDYGYGKINADAHVIVLNAADLGFVRNQYIRCKPNCKATNPMIYTYLENYPVAPFAQGGSNFGNPNGGGSYPTPAEAAAAVNSAVYRPLGSLATNPVTSQPCAPPANNPNFCSIARIADVAFEWAPPATNPTSSTRFGQLYAYIFHQDGSGTITETINWPNDPTFLAKLNGRGPDQFPPQYPIQSTDAFAPELDGLGFKQHPGVCFICHGGKPQTLTSSGAYPRQGNVSGFRLLPVDIRNVQFTSDLGTESTSRINQEGDIKKYNQIVLLTVGTLLERDDQGILRPPHLAEVIKGWYTDPGGTPFGRTTQNSNFIPVGWREPASGGTAPKDSEQLYKTVVGPSCRSCHFNRELSIDFGTYQNFKQESDLLQLALLPKCSDLRPGIYSPDANGKYMPLAHLTFQRLWQANDTTQYLSDGLPLFNTAEQIAHYFGYNNGVAGYCNSNP